MQFINILLSFTVWITQRNPDSWLAEITTTSRQLWSLLYDVITKNLYNYKVKYLARRNFCRLVNLTDSGIWLAKRNCITWSDLSKNVCIPKFTKSFKSKKNKCDLIKTLALETPARKHFSKHYSNYVYIKA